MTASDESIEQTFPKAVYQMEIRPLGYQSVAECAACRALVRTAVYPEHISDHGYQASLMMLALRIIPGTEDVSDKDLFRIVTETRDENTELVRNAMREAGYTM